jgi:hypothetical protein
VDLRKDLMTRGYICFIFSHFHLHLETLILNFSPVYSYGSVRVKLRHMHAIHIFESFFKFMSNELHFLKL